MMRTAVSITTTARRGTQIHTLANGHIRSHQVTSEGAEPFKTPTPAVFGNGGKMFGRQTRHGANTANLKYANTRRDGSVVNAFA